MRTSSRGHQARSDYILWPLDSTDEVENCRVNRVIELTDTERDDHSIVQADSSLRMPITCGASTRKPSSKGCGRLCEYKLNDPKLHYAFEQHVWSLSVDPSCGIDAHLAKLAAHMRWTQNL